MPLVSIGLPVFNGERYLEQAVQSLLDQSFRDFELVITDNCSTDGTETIGRRLAALDSRVRYHRNPENVGAAPNFNCAFELTSGKYFKWAAADDLCAPTFLERCVEILERDPSVVLAYPRTTKINADSEEVSSYLVKLETDHPDPVRRFAGLLSGHMCFEVFGVIRREALLRTAGMGSFNHGDGVLLAQLAFQGRFEEIPEALFFSRRHKEQSGEMIKDRRAYAIWFDPKLRGKILFPHWKTQVEFLRSILGPSARGLGPEARFRCLVLLLRRTYRARRLLIDDVRYHLRRLRQRPATEMPVR